MNFLTPLPPRLVAVGGFSGSGKTPPAVAPVALLRVWALLQAPSTCAATSNARRCSASNPLARLPDAAYQSDVNSNIYARLLDEAEQILLARHSVIIDATFLAEADRQAVSDLGSTFAGDVTVTPFEEAAAIDTRA